MTLRAGASRFALAALYACGGGSGGGGPSIEFGDPNDYEAAAGAWESARSDRESAGGRESASSANESTSCLACGKYECQFVIGGTTQSGKITLTSAADGSCLADDTIFRCGGEVAGSVPGRWIMRGGVLYVSAGGAEGTLEATCTWVSGTSGGGTTIEPGDGGTTQSDARTTRPNDIDAMAPDPFPDGG